MFDIHTACNVLGLCKKAKKHSLSVSYKCQIKQKCYGKH